MRPTSPLQQLRRASAPVRTPTNRERGSVAVEFALVVPVLLTAILGITEFGLAFSAQTRISAAAREGARTLAGGDTAANARSAAKTAAPGVMLSDAQITVSPTTCVGAGAGATATVTISYPYSFLTGMFGAGVTLNGTAVMRCES